jgi:hypothetical protein
MERNIQFDSLVNPLLASATRRQHSKWTHIGEAQISHTVFGAAEVRIVGTQGNARLVLLLIALGLVALAALLWQERGVLAPAEAKVSDAVAATAIAQSAAVAAQPESTVPTQQQPIEHKPKAHVATNGNAQIASPHSVPSSGSNLKTAAPVEVAPLSKGVNAIQSEAGSKPPLETQQN